MRNHPWWPWIKRVVGVVFLAVVAFLLVRYARTVDWDEVRRSVVELPRPVLMKAFLFAAASHFVYSLLDEGLTLDSGRGAEIAVGFVFAFISARLVVKPFLQFVRRAGFVPFAWYRIALGTVMLAAIAAGWR